MKNKYQQLIYLIEKSNKIISELKTEKESLHNKLIAKHAEIGRLNAINGELKTKLEWKDRKYGLVVFVLSLLLASQILINFLGE